MIRPVGNSIVWLLRLAAAAVLSFLLFTGVSLLHAAFGFGHERNKPDALRRLQTVDLIRKEPEKKKTVHQRIRRMQTSSAQGRSAQGQYDMRFSPDLNVDAPAGGGAEVTLREQELTAEIFDQGQVDEQAIPEYTPQIPYPERAIELGIAGNVEVVFVVTHQGKVGDIQVVSTPSPLFSSAVMRGVAQWRFKPAKKKGIPVNQRYRRVIEFILQ